MHHFTFLLGCDLAFHQILWGSCVLKFVAARFLRWLNFWRSTIPSGSKLSHHVKWQVCFFIFGRFLVILFFGFKSPQCPACLCFLDVPGRLEQVWPHPDLRNADLFWDLTNNVNYTFWKHESYRNVCPCILKNHVIWCVSKGRTLTFVKRNILIFMFCYVMFLTVLCYSRILFTSRDSMCKL